MLRGTPACTKAGTQYHDSSWSATCTCSHTSILHPFCSSKLDASHGNLKWAIVSSEHSATLLYVGGGESWTVVVVCRAFGSQVHCTIAEGCGTGGMLAVLAVAGVPNITGAHGVKGAGDIVVSCSVGAQGSYSVTGSKVVISMHG